MSTCNRLPVPYQNVILSHPRTTPFLDIICLTTCRSSTSVSCNLPHVFILLDFHRFRIKSLVHFPHCKSLQYNYINYVCISVSRYVIIIVRVKGREILFLRDKLWFVWLRLSFISRVLIFYFMSKVNSIHPNYAIRLPLHPPAPPYSMKSLGGVRSSELGKGGGGMGQLDGCTSRASDST